jgi:hypothetical protein
MPVSKHPLPAFRRLAPWLSLLAAGGLAACMETSPTATAPESGPAAASAQTLDQKPVSRPGVPDGCTLEWSSAKRDSVVYCPDLAPPSPR